MDYEFEQGDLGALVSDVVERMREQALAAGCTLAVQVPKEPVLFNFDRFRIEQVLVNLLGNAIKYAPEKPITVEVSSDELEARISVADQGMGIAPDKQEMIFERFGRATSKDIAGGLGLGLYISKQIVAAHGGTIEVESSPGQGSKFTVRLLKARPASAGLRTALGEDTADRKQRGNA
jgi:signal transduction histidine kinase